MMFGAPVMGELFLNRYVNRYEEVVDALGSRLGAAVFLL
jgi:hypothetical protein